jgi:hypothetical protein
LLLRWGLWLFFEFDSRTGVVKDFVEDG